MTFWTRVNTYLQLVSLKCLILHYNSFKMFPLDITDSKWIFVRHIFSKRIFKTNLCLKLNECLNVLLFLSSEVNLQSKRLITWRDLFTIIKSSEASSSMALILILDHFNPFSWSLSPKIPVYISGTRAWACSNWVNLYVIATIYSWVASYSSKMFSSGIWSIFTVYLMFLWSSSTDGKSFIVVLSLLYVLFVIIRANLYSSLKVSYFWFLSGC